MLPNLYRNRHGTYYLRVTHAGCEIKRSLRTKEPSRAKLAAIAFALARLMDTKKPFPYALPEGLDLSNIRELGIDPRTGQITDIRNAEEAALAVQMALAMKAIEAGASPEEALKAMQPLPGIPAEQRLANLTNAVAAAASPPPAPSAGKSNPFSEVWELYLEEAKKQEDPKGIRDKKRTYAQFQHLFGDQDFNAVSPEQAKSWKNRIVGTGASVPRVDSKISHMNMLFEWALDNHHRHSPNPFKTMRIGKKKGKSKKHPGHGTQETESYTSFEADDLARIFDPTAYTAFMGGRPDYHWLPILALHTGARVSELAGLRAGDLQTRDGITYISIERGKNSNSIRKVPLTDTLLASSFQLYARRVREAGILDASGEALLFPHRLPSDNGYGKNMGRHFRKWLDKLGIKDSRKVFHSFRSTFIRRMKERNVNAGMLMALVGHHDQEKLDLSSPHFQSYKGGSPLLSALKETIDRFDIEVPMDFTVDGKWNQPRKPQKPRPKRETAAADAAKPVKKRLGRPVKSRRGAAAA